MYPNFNNRSIGYISVIWLSQHQEPQTKPKDIVVAVDSHISN